MRPWLQDKDGDGVYALVTTKIPAGTYTFKVAHDLSCDESYPAGDLSVTVPADGARTTFLYDRRPTRSPSPASEPATRLSGRRRRRCR